ncbi:tetratricopeptide repeat protein [Altererythrobacter halimionae]|uniref:Tetratricopeptide repeat protein n=1 Tax=Alteriqipengyuania halimionae TaxID=1926630 RepID=A0A6I4U4Q3_9SPHN|nr:tetratricopeptide repeat protein [Alteriqipengyuania halimionae]
MLGILLLTSMAAPMVSQAPNSNSACRANCISRSIARAPIHRSRIGKNFTPSRPSAGSLQLGQSGPRSGEEVVRLAAYIADETRRPQQELLSRFHAALDLRERMKGVDHPETLYILRSIGWLHNNAAQLDEAERIMREVLVRSEGSAPQIYGSALTDLATVLMSRAKFTEARTLLRRALDLSLARSHASGRRPDHSSESRADRLAHQLFRNRRACVRRGLSANRGAGQRPVDCAGVLPDEPRSHADRARTLWRGEGPIGARIRHPIERERPGHRTSGDRRYIRRESRQPRR